MNLNFISRAFCLGVICFVLLANCSLADKPGPGTNTGMGRVFFPNPVASLQNQNLTDQKDADYPALQPAYRNVSLTNLSGSGYLQGDWANVKSSTGPLAYSSDNKFCYNRKDDQFEQVMAYYWITEAQKYIQSLGFGSSYDLLIRRLRMSGSISLALITLTHGTGRIYFALEKEALMMQRMQR